MLIYGFELEIVIHHDFIESSVVDVAREKWTETAKWEGGGRMWKGNEINNLSKKTTFKIHKYEIYPIEFTTMLFIWHGNELRACFLQVCGIAGTCCPSLNKFPPLSCDRKNRFRRWDGRRKILSSLLNLTEPPRQEAICLMRSDKISQECLH